ncbi:MAG TPA: O-antigen ligase family protein [Edaphobacter sp.]|nr:O-antigen ligase family protein [Edaphobacter sp.]
MMSQQLLTFAYIAVILAVFYFDRNKEARTSKALWIPVMWLMINGSRPVSMWFQSGPTLGNEYADGSPLDAAIFGALIVAGLITVNFRWKKLGGMLRNNSALLVFIAYCLASTLWSDYSLVSFKRWIKSVGDVIMVVIVLTEPDQRNAIKRFLCRVGYVVIPVSILFIKYYPDWGRSYNQWTWTPEYSGVTTFKNMLGMITLVCALGVLWSFFTTWRDRPARRWHHLVAQGIVLGMAAWIFHIANSMTSLSCFILASFVMIMANLAWIHRRPAFVHVLVAGVTAVSVVALFFDSSGGMVQSLGRNASLSGRTDLWRIVLELSKPRALLGAGFETFWMGDRLATVWRFEPGIQEAHNGYLEVYANLGWVGVILLAAVIVTGYRNVLATYTRDRTLGSIKIAYFATSIIYSLTEAGFRMMSPVWLGFLLAVIYVPSMRVKKKVAPKRRTIAAKQRELYPALASSYRDSS